MELSVLGLAKKQRLTILSSKKDFLFFRDHPWTGSLRALLQSDASFPPQQPSKTPVYRICANRGGFCSFRACVLFQENKAPIPAQNFLFKSSKASYPNGPHVNFCTVRRHLIIEASRPRKSLPNALNVAGILTAAHSPSQKYCL